MSTHNATWGKSFRTACFFLGCCAAVMGLALLIGWLYTVFLPAGIVLTIIALIGLLTILFETG